MILTSQWLVENKLNFPWGEIIGAKVSSKDGKFYLVKNVTLRKWPSGPLLFLQNLNDPTHNPLFSLVGFESNSLTQIEISASHSDRINSFWQQLESEKNKLDNSRQFDLLLFDLDNTLIASDNLFEIRQKLALKNDDNLINELYKESLKITILIPEEILSELRKKFPSIKLGIYSRAVGLYVNVILETCFPNITWDCLITHDSGKAKPHPDGIFKAANICDIEDFKRIALIGDHKNDILAAYQAGIYAVLFTESLRENWEIASGFGLHPDAIINNPEDIVALIISPNQFLPTLESFDLTDKETKLVSLRTDRLNIFHPTNNIFKSIFVLGRYFRLYNDSFHFDKKRLSHKLTQQILLSKETSKYPDKWINCCLKFIFNFTNKNSFKSKKFIICCVPFKPGRPRRLEGLVEDLKIKMTDYANLIFDSSLLNFKNGVKSNREIKNSVERYKNIEAHLQVKSNSNLNGAHILVFDDICTSGASFYYSDKYLKLAGADAVTLIALTHSI